LATLPVQFSGDATDLTAGGKIKQTTVVINQPMMPTNESLGIMAAQATANAVGAAAEKVQLDPNISNVLSALAEVPTFKEKTSGKPTQAMIDGNLVQIPPQVRDLPSNLYKDRQEYYVRGEADAILNGIFGDLAALANMWAAKRGFIQMPLVYLGNVIYRYVELDKKIDYKTPIKYDRPVYDHEGHSKTTQPVTYTPTMPFNSEIDDNDSGLLLPSLHRWLYHLTVRNLVRMAKEQNLSVVEILRCIIGQYDRDHKPGPRVRIR
jgi:hypothetical protein